MPTPRKKKILFVAMQNSSHTVRWINQISRSDYEIHLFPTLHASIHNDLRDVIIHLPWLRMGNVTIQDWLFWLRDLLAIKIKSIFKLNPTVNSIIHPLPWRRRHPSVELRNPLPFSFLFNLFAIEFNHGRLCLVKKTGLADELNSMVLSKVIRNVEPDLIHSLEFQHCGYIVLGAREIIGANYFPAWLVTNWGSDIFYFKKYPGEVKRISELLKAADFYSCECFRDVALAKSMGFDGVVLPVIPNAGGIDINYASSLRNAIKPSDRRIIVIKGYQTVFGRALLALESIKLCQNLLDGYKIIVYSASSETCEYVDFLKQTTSLDISIQPQITHSDMLYLFSTARIYIGISISDGISTSMLEAMAVGAFPIQTNTSCCDEWISDGVSGFSIPHDNVGIIVSCISRAIADDCLVDSASKTNWNTIRLRLDKNVIKSKAVGYYKTIFDSEDQDCD